MPRHRYEPIHSGWIGIQDHLTTIARIDCRDGSAQRVFEELCQDLARADWELQERRFDWRWVRKGAIRWEIRIGVLGPGEQARSMYGATAQRMLPASPAPGS